MECVEIEDEQDKRELSKIHFFLLQLAMLMLFVDGFNRRWKFVAA